MNTLTRALGAVFLIVLAGCNDTPPAQQTPTSQTAAISAPPASSWPPALEKGVELAKDPLVGNEMLFLDNSGSMNDRDCGLKDAKFTIAKAALILHIKSAPDDKNLALAVFKGSGARLLVPFGSGKDHKQQLIDALAPLEADQGTPLYASLKFVYGLMREQAMKQLGYGSYQIVIVTDGESTDYDPGPVAKQIVSESPVEIHTIGFCMKDHSLRIPGYTKYYTADSTKALADGLSAVQAESTAYQDPATFTSKD